MTATAYTVTEVADLIAAVRHGMPPHTCDPSRISAWADDLEAREAAADVHVDLYRSLGIYDGDRCVIDDLIAALRAVADLDGQVQELDADVGRWNPETDRAIAGSSRLEALRHQRQEMWPALTDIIDLVAEQTHAVHLAEVDRLLADHARVRAAADSALTDGVQALMRRSTEGAAHSGLTWQQLADHLGVTRQSAHERFTR